ncbi:MAG: hypothetical protein A2Z25_08725 [Planctomycetes bacterium RBG_16_55_9]|nr:MAG: hypothetical protein A2Z25_08725 [Planctomycetes bacterium RBG_16_55_9]
MNPATLFRPHPAGVLPARLAGIPSTALGTGPPAVNGDLSLFGWWKILLSYLGFFGFGADNSC